MIIKWFGAALIVGGCGGFGLALAWGSRREENQLSQLVRVLEFLETELQYRLTPLPELCLLASGEVGGCLGNVFRDLSAALSDRIHPDAGSCMSDVLQRCDDLSGRLRRHLRYLGKSLGRFDLPGQLQGLRSVRCACETDIRTLRSQKDVRLRSYQTLSLCAGAALVILFV